MDQSENKTIFFNNQSGDEGHCGKSLFWGKFVLFAVLLFLLTASITISMGVRFLHHIYQTLPSPQEIGNIQPSLVSKVVAADGSLVHEFSIERRFWVPLEQIPKELQQAVIAIEDRRFYTHWGIDIRRIIGAVFVNLVRGGYAQGASTLTQQLARNVYLTARQTMIRKIREALTAVQLESYYTKDEILELYMNMVYLGAGVYGVEAASQRYFSKSVSELSLNECAVLAGTIQLPERYRPDHKDNRERTIDRRNTVVRAMKKMHFIDQDQARNVIQDTIPCNPQKVVSKKAPYFVEVVRQYMESNYGEDLLYNGGLTIHTTIDLQAQEAAEKIASSHLDTLQRRTNRLFLDSTHADDALRVSRTFFLDHFDSLYNLNKVQYDTLPDSLKRRIVQVSVVALDVKTGAIRALIGGRNFNESKFNRAIQARRQPGSAFKPFVYTAALDSCFTPASIVMDQPITLETPEGMWRPENYEKTFHGPVTIRDALKKSINLVAIQVLQDIGVWNVINYARKAGLQQRLPPVPALAIGACQVTNLEITSAYSIYPHHGYQAKPFFVEKVYDKNDRLLEEHVPEVKPVLSPQTAYLMSSMMSTVVVAGTGASIGRLGFTRPAGGKTGTTNDYSDAWFVGFTPQIACGVWVGVDERRSMGYGVTGARGAIPIWVETMKKLHRDLPVEIFQQPEGIVTMRVCGKTNLMARRYCPDVYDEVFNENILPDSCNVHVIKRIQKSEDVIEIFGSQKEQTPEKANKKKRLIF